MSLARVALATCAHHDGFVAGDDEALGERLSAQGYEVVRPRWDDADVDWGGFDGVLIRTTWDYQHRLDEFLAWMEGVGERTRVFNAPGIVRGNVDKRYMRCLEAAGVPIVPTAWMEEVGGEGGVRAALASLGATRGVIKPVIGAGASGMLIFEEHEASRAGVHADEQVRRHGGVLVQPLLESVRTRGELSVVLIDGELTHAVRKIPASGEWRVQIEFGGAYRLEEPGERERQVASGAVGALCPEGPPLYARIDLVEAPGVGVAVIEAELVEPELFFRWAPEAGGALGRALARRLGLPVPSRG
ncbi:MAG: hypothetical protein R3B57_12420 [Phycisphaerales bacterium]